MNENWPEIVETLIPYFETNSVEGDYQREIENCLKFLGWKKTNGTMVSQYTLPIGNSNSIRPDIVLWRKNEHDTQSPVLPIEIKRPSNIQNERQENQLMSYMRQLTIIAQDFTCDKTVVKLKKKIQMVPSSVTC